MMQFVEPQLARPWVARRDSDLINTMGYSIEPKLDGHRVAVVRHSGGVVLLSRKGKQVQDIPWLMTWAQRQLQPGTYIDGELTAPMEDGSSHNVHSFRAYHPEKLCYVAFDVLWHNGDVVHTKHFHIRRKVLESISLMAHPWPTDGNLRESLFYIICSHPLGASTPQMRRRLLPPLWLAQGFEGTMYKHNFLPYKPNSRSGWVKQKQTMTVNVMVVGCEGKPSEWRVRPGHVGTDGILYPDGLHTDTWEAGHVGLEYGYGPYKMEEATRLSQELGCESRILSGGMRGFWLVAGTLGVTGPRDKMEAFVGKVATTKCWGTYPSGALRHPSPQTYTDWDGRTQLTPPDPTMETDV